MITNEELTAIELSATKKDFYQIWNELIDVASKLTNRWDPKATNESDPGIVLLKALTGIADKINYTIDKNILEAFMPSAAQMESMRKLCSMLGYNIKYYQSAETTVTIAYTGKTSLPVTGMYIPIFTTVKNSDGDVNYTITEGKYISSTTKTNTFNAIEGQVLRCETSNDNIVSLYQLDDNYHYLLPETMIAENGIFIWNISDGKQQDAWKKVDNLNSQPAGSKVYAFGYDSKEHLPYIQFPADVDQLIEDGFEIYYTRTSGVNGNISARTISALNQPEGWNDYTDTEGNTYSTEDFTVTNINSAVNGAGPESIDDAYNNFKKTIGTFDTLVTCRDYMNKIYQLVDTNNVNLVSNCIVTDIRDDINNAITLCGFDNYGICYKDTAIIDDSGLAKINNFDLILYPFKNIYGLNTKSEYKSSFTYDTNNVSEIERQLENYKTISHTYKLAEPGDIICIKNYLKLNAKITTTYKVTTVEQSSILANIRTAIYENFNMRKLDFGEEIPFDSILNVIENADVRIKNVSLDEPDIYTSYLVYTGTGTENIVEEYSLADTDLDKQKAAKVYSNKTLLRNILSGHIELFDYNLDFEPSFTEKFYSASCDEPGATTPGENYSPVYPNNENEVITKIESSCKLSVPTETEPLKLLECESVQFRAPNFITEVTYPAYVHYFLHLGGAKGIAKSAIPATFETLRDFMDAADRSYAETVRFDRWQSVVMNGYLARNRAPYADNSMPKSGSGGWADWTDTSTSETQPTSTYAKANTAFDTLVATYGAAYIKLVNGTSISYKPLFAFDDTTSSSNTLIGYLNSISAKNIQLYYVQLTTDADFATWSYWIRQVDAGSDNGFESFYRQINASLTNVYGYLIDADGVKYGTCVMPHTTRTDIMYTYYKLPIHWTSELIDGENGHTIDGLGRDAEVSKIPANTEYQLRTGDYLLINYTESSSDSTDSSSSTDTVYNLLLAPTDSNPLVIIRPNFDLYDTAAAHKYIGTSYSKKTGFDFVKYGTQYTPEGMFTLGSSEQIERINYNEVYLTETSNIYWNLVTDDGDDTLFFKGCTPDANKVIRRTLNDNEYLYYSDENLIDMNYYGSGSEIIFYNYNTQAPLSKAENALNMDAEAVLSEGIKAIPWIKKNFSSSGQYIVIKEYQYITLNETDELVQLGDLKSTIDGSILDSEHLTNTWVKLNPITGKDYVAEYRIDGETNTIAKIDIGTDSDATAWQVRSRLNFNFGQKTIQTLQSTRDTVKITFSDKNSITLTPKYAIGAMEATPLSIKGSMSCDVASDNIDLSSLDADDNTFKIKVFEAGTFGIETKMEGEADTFDSLSSQINAFGDGYTKIDFSSLNNRQSVPLQVNLYDETKAFGLIMIYYLSQDAASVTTSAYLTFTRSTGGGLISKNDVTIYNNNNSWWNDLAVMDTTSGTWQYALAPGINIIKISKSGELKLHPDRKRPIGDVIYGSESAIISGLDIVNCENNPTGINNAIIGYQATTTTKTAEEELLFDINKIDTNHEFYYNVRVENSVAIDLLTDSIYDEDNESLASPHVLYDYNNVNNKFVISEIDADYLDSGIMIAKSSRK